MSPKPQPVGVDALAASIQDLLVGSVPQDLKISGIAYDSRRVSPGDLFCCVPGLVTDGHEFAGEAVAAGAVGLVTARPLEQGVPELVVTDVRVGLARLSAAFYGHPADGLLMLGVTGTNGKTTTAFLLESILAADGHVTGLIGTIETHVASDVRPGLRTTPESLDLQRLLGEMRDRDVGGVAMEVTSHGLVLQRIEGIRFQSAAFTNLSQDHLDFHTGMEDYFAAKQSLFTPARCERAAINLDDPYGRRIADECAVPFLGFGIDREAEVTAKDVELAPTGSTFLIVTPKGDIEIETPLIGSFNVYNCLTAAATSLQAGIGLAAIERGLRAVTGIPGRFQSVDQGQPFSVIVDYAHTPDSLDNVLRAARDLADRQGGRVICIFGAGGDRDRAKRPLMGAVAARLADVVIVTSDNPRSEDPNAIVGEILEGVTAESPQGADHVLVDRTEAIATGIRVAGPGDVVVIAGKGHETGQEFADRTIPFDDREVAWRLLVEAGWGTDR